MSTKYKCVQINLEDSLYEFLNKYLDEYIPDTDISKGISLSYLREVQNVKS